MRVGVKQGSRGAAVEHLHRVLLVAGFEIDAAELSAKRFGRTTGAALTALRAQRGLSAHVEIDAPVLAVLIEIEGGASAPGGRGGPNHGRAAPPASSHDLKLQGRVTNTDGAGLAGMTLNALRLQIGGRATVVGTVRSQADGTYEIVCRAFSPASPTVVTAIDKGAEIGRSAQICETAGMAQADVAVTADAYRSPPEFEAVTAALRAPLAGARPKDLTDDDLAILACAASLEPAKLIALRLADQITDGSRIPVGAVYGLLRVNPATTRNALLVQPAAVLAASLAGAVAARVAPPMSNAAMATAASALAALRIGDLLAPAATSGLAHLLEAVIPAAAAPALLEAYTGFTGPDAAFWSNTLSQTPGFADPATRDRVLLATAIGGLTLGHAPLVAALLAPRQPGGPAELVSLRDLAKLDVDDWTGLLNTTVNGVVVGVPAGVPGATPADQVIQFAQALVQTVAIAMPGAALAAQLGRSPDAALKAVGALLDANPDLDLTGAAVAKALPPPAGADAALQAAHATLGALQRLIKVTPVASEVLALHAAGYSSAWALAQATPAVVKAALAGAVSAERAQALVDEATYRAELTLSVIAAYSHNTAGETNAAVTAPTASATAAQAASFVEVFGPEVVCTCEEFEALDGFWAYFVSLLFFLPADARAELRRRRPELWNLRFSEANVETEDRYLSLVLEVLEAAVVTRDAEVKGQAASALAYDNQTTWTSDQLILGPEYETPGAYDPPAAAIFPWSLPFDLPATRARAFGGLLGVPRFQLMEALQNSFGAAPAPSPVAAAQDFAGLTAIGWDLICGVAGGDPYPGLSATPAASVFLSYLGIKPEQLVDLFSTRFVNPPATPFADRAGLSLDDTCDASQASLLNVDAGVRDRVHRFIRLWRALGWPMAEVDRAIGALAPQELDAPGLLQIVAFARLRGEVSLPLTELLTWWSDIDTVDDAAAPTQFAQLFPAADLVAGSWAPGDPAILSGLGVSIDDVALFRGAAAKNLGLAGLSAVFRSVSLARWLGLTADAFVAVQALITAPPFATVDQTRRFLAAVGRLKASGFTLPELRYLLAGQIAPDAPQDLGVSSAQAIDFGTQLAALLAPIVSQTAAAAAMPATAASFRVVVGARLSPGDTDRACAIIEGGAVAADAAFVAAQLDFLLPPVQTRILTPLATPRAAASIAEIAGRYAAVLPPLIAALDLAARTGVAVKQVATRFALAPAIAQALLSEPFSCAFKAAPTAPLDLLINGVADPVYWGAPAPATPDPGAVAELLALLTQLDRQATIVNRLIVTPSEFPRLVRLASNLNPWLNSPSPWLDLSKLPAAGDPPAPFAALDCWIKYRALARTQPAAAPVLDILDPTGAPLTKDAVAARLYAAADDIEVVAAALGTPGPAAPLAGLTDITLLWRAVEALQLVRRSRLGAVAVVGWIADPVTQDVADGVEAAARAFYGDAQWSARAKPVIDGLLERQRTALYDYLKGAGLPGDPVAAGGAPSFPDDERMLATYLVDVGMGASFLTSRLGLARTSLQYFIDRCFNGQEPMPRSGQPAPAPIVLGEPKPQQWASYMSQYRVWQAAVDILINPGKYNDITLYAPANDRYAAFAQSLAQQTVTEETVTDAVQAYLAAMADLAKMEVVGFYEDLMAEPADLHVIARTQASPATYYYARRSDLVWTAWQRISADIDAGDTSVLVTLFQNRLFALWPVVTAKTDDDQGPAPVPDVNSATSAPMSQPSKHLEIQLAWTALHNGKWAAKQLSDTILPTDWAGLPPAPEMADQIVFKAAVVSVANSNSGSAAGVPVQELHVICGDVSSLLRDSDPSSVFGDAPRFVFTSSTSAPTISSSSGFANYRPPLGTGVWNGFVLEGGDRRLPPGLPAPGERSGVLSDALILSTSPPAQLVTDPPQDLFTVSGFKDSPVLAATPGTFDLLFPQQYAWPSAQSLFFSDNRWVFFAEYKAPPQKIFFPIVDPIFFDPTRLEPPVIPPVAFPAAAASAYLRTMLSPAAAPVTKAVVAPVTEPVIGRGPIKQPPPVSGPVTVPILKGPKGPKYSPQAPGDYLYRFYTFSHPRTADFIERLNVQGLSGLLRRYDLNPVQAPTDVDPNFFKTLYKPEALVDLLELPRPGVEFDTTISPHAADNQNLFFYGVMRAAAAATAGGAYDFADWLWRAILNPMSGSGGAFPTCCWNYEPFRTAIADTPNDLFGLLSNDHDAASKARQRVAAWTAAPFDSWSASSPFALMKTTARGYIENILSRADQNFSQAVSQEQVLLALADYIWALHFLGPKPEPLEPTRAAKENPGDYHCFADIETSARINAALPDLLESALPPLSAPAGYGGGLPSDRFPFATSVQFLFCLPQDTTFFDLRQRAQVKLGYIRAGLNFSGQPQAFSVFGPRIDPSLLIRAAAAGIDLTTALATVDAPRATFRYTVLMQRAKEFTGELRAVSASMLAALTEDSAETLSELRATQEIAVLNATLRVKDAAVDEAAATLASLNDYRDVLTARYVYYSTRPLISPGEGAALEMTAQATLLQTIAQAIAMTSAELRALPNFVAGLTGIGGSPTATVSEGGDNLGSALSQVSAGLNLQASLLHAQASATATVAGYQRRADDWEMQAATTQLELVQNADHILAQQARLAAAQADRDAFYVQHNNAQAVSDYLAARVNNVAFRQYRINQLSALAHQGYLMAFSLAKAAERAYQFERGYFDGSSAPAQSFIQFGYWQNNFNGVTAADQLASALEQMEAALATQDLGDKPLPTIALSLSLIGPAALEQLRRTGSTGSITFDELQFARALPEQYFLRIRRLRVRVPSVTGPYTPILYKVQLNSYAIRLTDALNPSAQDPIGYAEAAADPDRFYRPSGAVEVMYTTGRPEEAEPAPIVEGQYRPFEGAGAANASFTVSFPPDLASLYGQSIADVIFEFELSCRVGSPALAAAAAATLAAAPSYALVRLSTDLPEAWYQALNPLDPTAPFTVVVPLRSEMFPYAGRRTLTVASLTAMAVWQTASAQPAPSGAISCTLGGPDLAVIDPGAAPTPLTPEATVFDAIDTGSVTAFDAAGQPITRTAPATATFIIDPTKLAPEWLDQTGPTPQLRKDLLLDFVVLAKYTAA